MPDGSGQNQNSEGDGVVKRLLSKSDDQEPENGNLENQGKEEDTDQNQTDEPENESELAESEITEELAKVLGLPDSFIGKPLSEAGKSYKNTVTWESKNNRLIKNLESKISDFEGKLTESQQQRIERQADQETADQFGDVPDPVNDLPGFKKWMAARDEKLLGKFNEQISKSLNDNPVLKQSQEMAAKELERQTISGIKDGLPEGSDVDEILNAWLEDNQDDYEAMIKAGFYKNNPKKLIRDVVNWYKANSFDSLKNGKESDITKQIHKQVKENLLKRGPKKAQSTSVQRSAESNDDSFLSRRLPKLEAEEARKVS